MKKIKVLVADDHKMFVDGLMSLLDNESGIEVVGFAHTGEQVLATLATNSVDVIVLDIEMPKLDGLETAILMKRKYPKVKILILSMYKRKAFAIKLMEIGVAGYILKEKSKEELVGAIYNVHKGKSHFSLEILDSIVNSKHTKQSGVNLTNREIEVLKLIAEGLTSKEIAERLHVAVSTINTHRKSLHFKVGVNNNTLLVKYAIKEGYIKI